jgi:hypothetical protein
MTGLEKLIKENDEWRDKIETYVRDYAMSYNLCPSDIGLENNWQCGYEDYSCIENCWIECLRKEY